MGTQAQAVNTNMPDFTGFPEATAPAPNLSIMDKTICLSLSFGSLGNSRKVSTSEIEVDADKKLLHVSKRLLDSKELKAITHHDGELRSYMDSIRLPSLFRAGISLIPIPAIQDIENRLQEHATKRTELVEAFLAVYTAAKEQAEERLKSLYNPQDYPPVSAVRGTFKFSWSWISFSTPAKLKEISASFFKQEQEKAAAHWAQANEEVRQLLRAQLKDLVDHFAEILTPEDGGKPKRFHASTVTKITDFLDSFSIRNVTSDTQLEQVVGHMKAILNGVDAEAIRKQDNIREYVGKGMSLIKQTMDTLVEDAGSRLISLEDE